MSIEIYGKKQESAPMPSGNDWIFPGSDIRPPIEDDWALYLDPMKDDLATLQAGAAAIMQEWAGITSVDGRIFSGREQKALDPREYYQKAMKAFREGSLASLWSPEWQEFMEAEQRGDKAVMRAMAAKNIKGEGVGHAVREGYDKYSQTYLADVDRGLNSIRDALSPEELAILDEPRALDPEYEALLEEDNAPRMSDGPAYGLPDPQRDAVEARQAQLDRARFDRHDELYRKHHDEIEGERRLAAYRRQLEDENLWAVIESLKGHISDGAQHVVDMALQSGDKPTSSAVMKEFEKLSTPEQRSIAGILQALHYSHGGGVLELCKDAGNAFANTLEMVTVGAVRGATDLVRRTWMDGDEYRDMVERRVLLEDANRERMNEWGYLGNTVIGVASTIPYIAAAAIPYVGMADMMLAARDEFQGEAMRNGVDVSDPSFILGSSAFAIAYAYVEKIQWERMGLGSLSKLTNLSRRQMYCDMFHSVRAALGAAGAIAGSMLTESGEEGIQRAMEVTVAKWGGATLGDALAGFTEDFVQSLGTMAILGTVGAGRQHIAYRHGALGYDKAEAISAQSRSIELEQRVLGNPGEVGPLASYGRTYGRMVEHWLNAGTDADARQATLMRWGLDAEQAQAIHGALQSVWTSIEGADTSAETKEEQKSALVGGGRVLTPAEVIAQIQNGTYRGKVEDLGDGKQAVNLSIAGKTLRMVVDAKRAGSEIDPGNTAMFESIVNTLNSRNVLDADGAKFTVEGWTKLSPEERKTIIDANGLRNQGDVQFFDADGNKVGSMDGRVLDAITGRVRLTDSALPQTAFHETMHGVLNILSNLAMGEKDETGNWKVEPDKDAAQLVQALSKAFPDAKGEALGAPQTAREAVNEELFADSFQSYLTGKIDVVEHNGLFDRIGRFLANLFGYGGKTHEFATPRTDQQRLFNTAITGHIAQALEAAEETKRDQAPEQGDQVRNQGDQAGDQAAPAPEPAPSESESILRDIEESHPDLAETVAMFRNRDPLTKEQMDQLREAGGEAFDDRAIWNAGYRWNEAQTRFEHFDKLEGTLDERDMPQAESRGSVTGRLVPGADLSNEETARELVNFFKTYEGEEPPKRLLDASPAATYAWFKANLVGNTFQIGDRTFTVKEGHYFRFVCETPEGDRVRKGWIDRAESPEDARRLVEIGEVEAKEIAGYVPSRAASLPYATAIFTKPDAILSKGHKEYLLKKFKTGNANTDVAVFLLNRDGETLGLSSIHMREIGVGFLNGCTLAAFANEGASSPPGSLARDVLSPTDDARDTSAGTPQSQTPNAPDVNSEKQARAAVAPSRLPSPEFAMDGTVVDALPAHLRADARAIVAERANTPRWMTDPDGSPTELNERDWLRREAEARYEVAANISSILSRFDEAKGKSKQEIFAQFDNTQKVIGELPEDLELPTGLDVKERVVKGAEAFILNHVLNESGHEFQYTAEDARRVLGLIDPANEMRVVAQRGSLSLAFIAENPNGGWDCIVIAPKRGEFFIFKTMFGQKRKPYQDKTRIRYSGTSVRRGEAANPLIRGGLTSIRDFSDATRQIQPSPGAEVNSENGTTRGSVAGSDPGWFDVAGQAEAAEREARDVARHGMAFGGARFSNRSWVEAFAARDKALKIERTDEDYNRLIDALGLKGKMTAAEAREAADALQREVKGGADVISDLVKAAEKKNFRRTVENIVTAAHGYGVEVGANARKAWEKFLSEMRRTAKGRDAEDFTRDMGLDIAAMLLNAPLEESDGKPNAPQAGEKTDEEAALEAALIDGTESDMGLTAEEAQARLRELLEAKMGDVEERRKRLGEALDAWRSTERERQRKLLEMQEERAAKEARASDNGEGKGKGERSEEEEEEEAVRELPDYKAFIERLKADGWNLNNAGEFAFVLRFYVEDWLAKRNGVERSNVLKDPVAAAQYRRTVIQLLRDACNQLLDPNDGVAARTAERMLAEIPGDASANEIQSRSRSIIAFIQRNAIRQSRKQMVEEIRADIDKLAIKGKMFDETEKDIGRKITGEREPYCRYVRRILLWGDQRIAAEMQRLNDIISGRTDAYKASRGEDSALEALAITDREIHRATERLNALQLWGGLRKKSPAEIARAARQIHDWLERERDEHEKRWADWMSANDERAARLAAAVSASMGDYTPDDPGYVGQLSDALTTNFRARLERLAVGSGAEGRRIIDELMMLVYAGSERLGVLKAQRRERTDAMLARCVEGTGQTVGEFLKSLNENIPEELNRRLATEEQPTRMTWGQALQLLGSLEQTASYQRNIDENGRGAIGLDGKPQTPHRDLILQALADKPQMLRLVEEMRKIYDADREAISEEFFAVTGNHVLTPDPLYLPARMFTGARDNLETTVRAWNPFGPAFTPRIANKRDFNLSASIMDVYNERMKETATALAFGMRGMELRSILARKSVQEAIARTHGKFALRKMIAQLTDIVSDGYKGDGGQLEGYRKAIRAVGDLTTYSALSWNVVTMLKQMTSIPAWTALLDGGYGEIFHHIVHFDKEAAKELMAAPGFTARYGADSFAKMFKQELDNPQGGNLLSRLYKAGMTAVQMGDFVPGILVGQGVYKARKLALMRKGLAEGAAREQAARETWGLIEENQQSSRLENTPEILRRGGFIGRQLSKFASSPMMQVGHEVHTLRMWLAEARLEARHGGKESGAVKAMLNAKGDDAVRWRKRFVNQFVCNHVLMPAAMYAIATVFKAALGGEPPDKEEVYGDLVMQMVAGPWSRIFLLGAVADTTGEWAARLMGGKPNVYSRGDLSATQHLHKAMSNAGRLLYDAMDMDWASCRDDFVKMSSSYNAPFRYAATITQNATGYDPAQARRRRKREIAKREAAE